MCHAPSISPNPHVRTQQHLIARVASRERDALAELYRETRPLAFAIAIRILKNREAAEEAVQDAYLQIWSQAASFDPERGKPAAWITTIVRCRALDRLRKMTRERLKEDPEPAGDHAGPDNPEHLLSRSELAVRVRQALSQLSREQRKLIVQSYYVGLSHREIARRTEIPLGTIKTRIRSAMQHLRRSLHSFQPASLLD